MRWAFWRSDVDKGAAVEALRRAEQDTPRVASKIAEVEEVTAQLRKARKSNGFVEQIEGLYLKRKPF